jgi:hypothetical protein
MSQLQPCDKNIFEKGKPLLIADTDDDGGDVSFEAWVQAIAKESKQKADWHYSGGRAQVLYIGKRDKLLKAAKSIPCPARIMQVFGDDDHGLYRRGVSPSPF